MRFLQGMTPLSNCAVVDKTDFFSKSKIWTKFTNDILIQSSQISNYSRITPYLLSLLDVAYYIGISPGRVYQSGATYEWRPPTKLRLVLCVIWHTLVLINIFTDLKQTTEEGDGKIPNAIAMIFQIAYILYLFYISSFLILLWTQMDSLVAVLNETCSVITDAHTNQALQERDYRIICFISVRTTVIGYLN